MKFVKYILFFAFFLGVTGCYYTGKFWKLDSKDLLEFKVKELNTSSVYSDLSELCFLIELKNIHSKTLLVFGSKVDRPPYGYRIMPFIGNCYEYGGRSDLSQVQDEIIIEPGESFIDTLTFKNCKSFKGEIILIYDYGIFNKEGVRLTRFSDVLKSGLILIK